MDRPRIALLNASFDQGNTRRNFRRELDATIVEFDAIEGHVPPDFDYDAVLVTGSRASVYWNEDWIDAGREYAADAVDAGLPVLGVCWGHQLLADALGGEVRDMDGYELGYRTVRTTDAGRSDPIFDGVDEEFTVFTTHGDEVTELPADAAVLAENDYSIQAFRVGRAVGVQFHPEYDTDTARDVASGKDFLPDERVEAALAGITDENYRAACETKQVFANFVREVRSAATAE